MPDTSPILSLPYLMANQAQKHVTHNEALQRLDMLVQLTVESFDDDTPPSPAQPDRVHALGATPTGAWAGQPHMLAVWHDNAWMFLPPQPGWRAWGMAESELRVWDGSTWVTQTGSGGAPTGPFTELGINTGADPVNRLAVRSDATLLTHDGAGHQLKINKAAAADTASLLFQSDWTGHAEMGLSGGTGFSLKTSGDGSTWTEALHVDGAGLVGIGGPSSGAGFEVQSRARIAGVDAVQTAPEVSACTLIHESNSQTGNVLTMNAHTSGGNAYDFIKCYSGNWGDKEMELQGDGDLKIDRSLTSGGADYAEFFEWADGNPQEEDRRGISVVLDGALIRPAKDGEEPIGVVSASPSVIGDGDMDRWKGKYLRDDFGGYQWEEYEGSDPEDEDGTAVTLYLRRVLNPDFNPEYVYVPRAERAEWTPVGLMGKLRLRIGQPTGARWVRMRVISDTVEEWLVR